MNDSMNCGSPRLLPAGRYTDSRGELRFCNDFDMSEVRRFYTIRNAKSSPIRGWIGHRMETKWFFPVSGTTTIRYESFDAERHGIYELNASVPALLEMPCGNWFAIEQDGSSEIIVFSNSSLGEFKNDDLRRPL